MGMPAVREGGKYDPVVHRHTSPGGGAVQQVGPAAKGTLGVVQWGSVGRGGTGPQHLQMRPKVPGEREKTVVGAGQREIVGMGHAG